ncbi:AAA family ATPase [Nocardia arthritidis]|uniref:AAA family ATPase n=1 Tax=Nocardia arthritidis TaxID=228602 RepID=A0A6G9YH42_9NOCA|nr:AAA family ATPase [Nocardia arthritidis]QIS12283.1 AAA family ATPase [Nocardia arthritidis]
MKYFNTTGPCDEDLHYMLPAAQRITDADRHIARGQYFVVHAPRQTGKTTSLAALARELTAEGRYVALHFSCEVAVPFGDDFTGAVREILARIRAAAEAADLPSELLPPTPWPESSPGSALVTGLTAWTRQCPRPLVLFFDEIDAIRGDSLVSVLRQLRDGYTTNRKGFVHAVVLCGMRDVRDYKSASGGDPTRLSSSSPFNIKVDSIRIGDFTRAEVATLYAQHTAATGQEFSCAALDLAYYYTQGQPWLVNALAAEVIDKMRIQTTITDDHIDEAKERLILARATHLDSLVAKLTEPRVQRVIEPLIAGTMTPLDLTFNDDVTYVRDLGLIANDKTVRIANPIYNEVIVRVLGAGVENNIHVEPASFRLPDGRLDFPRLLTEFAAFWKKDGEILTAKQNYHETAPQLVLMAYLHRIVNGGGHIDREYGIGHGRIDLLVRQPYTGTDGHRAEQREAIELKVWRDKQADPLSEGLTQLDGYLDRLGLPTGVLAIFDRRTDAAPITDRTTFSTATTPAGREVTLLRA